METQLQQLADPESLARALERLDDEAVDRWVTGIGLDSVLDTVFSVMADRYRGEPSRPRAVIQWNLQTTEGPRTYHVDAAAERCTAEGGPASGATVELTARLPTFLRIVSGRLSGLQAYARGDLQVTGDTVVALLQQTWFDVDLSQAEIDISTPSELARLIDGRSDAELEAGIAVNGIDVSLERIFQGMVEHFLPRKAGRKRAVVQFDIRSPEGVRTYQFVADREGAAYHARAEEKPRVRVKVGFADFLRMVAGRLDGVQAFARGKVKVGGNLLVARGIQHWFDMSR